MIRWCAKPAANTPTFDPKPDGCSMLLNDQIHSTAGRNARSSTYDPSEGRIGMVPLEEGVAFLIKAINLVANSENRETALAFIRPALSPVAQKAFTQRTFYGLTNTRAQVTPEAMQRTVLAPEYRARAIGRNRNGLLKLRDGTSTGAAR